MTNLLFTVPLVEKWFDKVYRVHNDSFVDGFCKLVVRIGKNRKAKAHWYEHFIVCQWVYKSDL